MGDESVLATYAWVCLFVVSLCLNRVNELSLPICVAVRPSQSRQEQPQALISAVIQWHLALVLNLWLGLTLWPKCQYRAPDLSLWGGDPSWAVGVEARGCTSSPGNWLLRAETHPFSRIIQCKKKVLRYASVLQKVSAAPCLWNKVLLLWHKATSLLSFEQILGLSCLNFLRRKLLFTSGVVEPETTTMLRESHGCGSSSLNFTGTACNVTPVGLPLYSSFDLVCVLDWPQMLYLQSWPHEWSERWCGCHGIKLNTEISDEWVLDVSLANKAISLKIHLKA